MGGKKVQDAMQKVEANAGPDGDPKKAKEGAKEAFKAAAEERKEADKAAKKR